MRPITRLKPQNSIRAPTASAASWRSSRSCSLGPMLASIVDVGAVGISMRPREEGPGHLGEELPGVARGNVRQGGKGRVALLFGDPACGPQRAGAREPPREGADPRAHLLLRGAGVGLQEGCHLLAERLRTLESVLKRERGFSFGD